MKSATPKALLTACLVSFFLGACTRTEEASAPVISETKTPTKAVQPPPITRPEPMPYEEPVVGGALMSAGNDLMANIAKSRDHTTLLRAIRASGMDEILKGPGPFTLFAPTNAAFERLPAGTVDKLLKPENRAQLISLLSYHIIPEHLDAEALEEKMLASQGTITLQTLEGPPLKATVSNGKAMLVDTRGTFGKISIANVLHSNGVMHVIDTVMMPKPEEKAR